MWAFSSPEIRFLPTTLCCLWKIAKQIEHSISLSFPRETWTLSWGFEIPGPLLTIWWNWAMCLAALGTVFHLQHVMITFHIQSLYGNRLKWCTGGLWASGVKFTSAPHCLIIFLRQCLLTKTSGVIIAPAFHIVMRLKIENLHKVFVT